MTIEISVKVIKWHFPSVGWEARGHENDDLPTLCWQTTPTPDLSTLLLLISYHHLKVLSENQIKWEAVFTVHGPGIVPLIQGKTLLSTHYVVWYIQSKSTNQPWTRMITCPPPAPTPPAELTSYSAWWGLRHTLTSLLLLLYEIILLPLFWVKF